jgi:CubicO group peptidase (beta-lactamase class C family)
VPLQLADEGVVGRDGPVDACLPDLPAADGATLRMLANSTSGYVDYVPMDSYLRRPQEGPLRGVDGRRADQDGNR